MWRLGALRALTFWTNDRSGTFLSFFFFFNSCWEGISHKLYDSVTFSPSVINTFNTWINEIWYIGNLNRKLCDGGMERVSLYSQQIKCFSYEFGPGSPSVALGCVQTAGELDFKSDSF